MSRIIIQTLLTHYEAKFKDKDVCEALTAFGGIVLIKKSVLSLSGWSTKCENAKKYKGYKCQHF